MRDTINIFGDKMSIYGTPAAFGKVSTKFANWMYLHGDLETVNGYDKFSIASNEYPTERGIYPVIAHILNDKTQEVEKHNALLFLWFVDYNKRERGFVVSIEDEGAIAYAFKSYNEVKEDI